ncbi:uncharacterized protein LOC118186676 [Stegodyphus dumicola]|uniref:uncharacterized protein LOC118186676 n=1 Tax=Stegodyphus dumicola TaxID=202533 RepID=UPI0015AE7351|nr:uncharacterized protein LOC118186676 [Stegodyphus dumicola]
MKKRREGSFDSHVPEVEIEEMKSDCSFVETDPDTSGCKGSDSIRDPGADIETGSQETEENKHVPSTKNSKVNSEIESPSELMFGTQSQPWVFKISLPRTGVVAIDGYFRLGRTIWCSYQLKKKKNALETNKKLKGYLKMGRSGSDLKPFLHNALKKEKYHNLVCKNASFMIFQLIFPRKNENLSISYQRLLKDWDSLKGRTYRGLQDYSRAMRAFKRALKKSDYIVCLNEKELIYRFSSEQEIEEIRKRRKRKKEETNIIAINLYSPCSSDSGYDTAKSPEAALEYDHSSEKNSILYSIAHDHFFGGISEEACLLKMKKEELSTIPDEIPKREYSARFGNEIRTENISSDDLLVYLESMDTESLPPLNEKDYDILCKDLLSDPNFNSEFFTSLDCLLDSGGHPNLTQETCKVWQFEEMCNVTQDLLMFIFKPLEITAVKGIQNCEGGTCFHMPGKEMEIFQCSRIVKLYKLKDNYIMYLQLEGQFSCI